MKRKLNRIKGYSRSLLCFSFLVFASNFTTAQTLTDPSVLNPGYDAAKLAAARARNPVTTVVAQTQTASNEHSLATSCGDRFVIPFGPSIVPRSDDGSFGPIALPFTYNLFGTSYNQVWINNNGTLTFTGPYGGFTAEEFPIELPVLAPFWADVDTRNTAGGFILYKVNPTNLIVTWDNVGYFNSHVDKLNTFQVIITDGTDPLLPDANTSFAYWDMQWTTGDASGGIGGFGGLPAGVGLNRGNHSVTPPFFVRIGRFNADNANYDGPDGMNDGVNYLDRKCFSFDARRDCRPEFCNGVDDDCDGVIDEDCIPNAFYRDADHDGYGNPNIYVIAPSAPPGYVAQNGDCDDFDASINPGATEVCNFRDDDCDGIVDEGCNVYYRDGDGDGYGLWDQQIRAMSLPPGYSTIGGDCHDWDASIHPGATEICNFKDDNCNGIVDEGCNVYYRDADGDGYGLWDQQVRAMVLPPGYSSTGGDCNDANPAIRPGATEICNGVDDNCNGVIDESCTPGSASVIDGRTSVVKEDGKPAALSEFNIAAYPNPSKHLFSVSLEGDPNKGKITVRIYDHVGRLVEMNDNLATGQVIKLGAGYKKGVYIVEAAQGATKKTVKIIKL